MKISTRHETPVPHTYRAERTRSMFNVTEGQGSVVVVEADLPLEEFGDWSIGLVVGPSGSGKTTIGRALWDGAAFYDPAGRWPHGVPIVEAIAPDADYDTVVGALAAVGLGDVPAWLRPYDVLSMGERFRADLAAIVATAPARVVVDEFTSVVDRQIAKVGASAFAKAWRRTGGQAVLLSCHHDIVEWLAPDWIWDTAERTFTDTKGCLQRPGIEVDIFQTDRSWWRLFKPHHYLDVGPMPFSTAYVATVDGAPVAHLGVSSKYVNTKAGKRVEARACRMVVMPEWQGAGLGTKFLNHVADMYLQTGGHLHRPCTTQFHTSHPGLVTALRRDPRWRQISASMNGKPRTMPAANAGGFGGHFRAVQGFRYVGTSR